jgi:hypothetical protein
VEDQERKRKKRKSKHELVVFVNEKEKALLIFLIHEHFDFLQFLHFRILNNTLPIWLSSHPFLNYYILINFKKLLIIGIRQHTQRTHTHRHTHTIHTPPHHTHIEKEKERISHDLRIYQVTTAVALY